MIHFVLFRVWNTTNRGFRFYFHIQRRTRLLSWYCIFNRILKFRNSIFAIARLRFTQERLRFPSSAEVWMRHAVNSEQWRKDFVEQRNEFQRHQEYLWYTRREIWYSSNRISNASVRDVMLSGDNFKFDPRGVHMRWCMTKQNPLPGTRTGGGNCSGNAGMRECGSRSKSAIVFWTHIWKSHVPK